MDEAKASYLYTTYPTVFPPKNRDLADDPFRYWGFQVEDGWFGLIEEAAKHLATVAAHVVQVKQKFGGLRIYVEPNDFNCPIDPETSKLLADIEARSYDVCEICGQPSRKDKPKNWSSTFCVACDDIRIQENKALRQQAYKDKK